uniref:Uncharacterized protein n=1 Tax=Ascaris lumbricoides TaxID=6252 RepID=A0A9J2P403_ASCLU
MGEIVPKLESRTHRKREKGPANRLRSKCPSRDSFLVKYGTTGSRSKRETQRGTAEHGQNMWREIGPNCAGQRVMPVEGADRAARLGALLASRNALIRHEAAEAIGHFPLTNPQIPVLIRQYLQNGAWETRIDAAEALRFTLRSTPVIAQEVVPCTHWLASLDLCVLVRDYYPLLSCETELVNRMGSSAFGEQCKFMDKQRKFMDEQLSLQPKAGVSSEPFVCDADFINYSELESSNERKLNLETSLLSLDEDNVCDELDLALHRLCSQLLNDLADSRWEVRHGAALAFAAIISTVPYRLSAELIDLTATRLFQTLALDNFIDFASGRSAVGPVREGVAECIAKLIDAYPTNAFVEVVAKHVFALQNMNDTTWTANSFARNAEASKHLWFQRQAALLVLKYHFAGPSYHLKFQQFYALITLSFEDKHDEVSSAALSAITALFCKENLKEDVAVLLSGIELVIYRFIEAACSATRQQQLMDVDTVIVDLLTLLLTWMRSSETRTPPSSVLISLSRLLNPMLVTRCIKIVNVFSVCFSRQLSVEEPNGSAFEDCCMHVLSSLFRVVLFAAPQETNDLIEACISCAYCVSAQISFLNRLPCALVETFGRWSACLLLDAKCAQIDVMKHNVGEQPNSDRLELMCGDEIRALSDMERIDALITRKVHVARFLAPLLSAIHSFPSMIGDQSLSDATELLITPMLSSPAIMHRLGGSLLTHSWFSYNWVVNKRESNPPIFLVALLQRMVQSPALPYDDEKFFFHYMDSAYKEFVAYCRRKGAHADEIEHIESTGGPVDVFARKVFDMCYAQIKKEDDRLALTSHYENFKNVVATAKAVMTLNALRVNALLVSALITACPQVIAESSTLNPFVKPFMELLRCEENLTVTRHALNSLPVLFRMTSLKKPSPHAKMLKQIVTNLTSCENCFPQDFELSGAVILSQKPMGTPSIRALNAEFAVRALTVPFACVDLSCLLDFRKCDSPKVTAMYMDAFRVYIDEIRKLECTVPCIVSDVLPSLREHLISQIVAVRFCAARCVATIARLDGALLDVLQFVIVPLQKDLRSGVASVNARCGLVEVLFFLSELNVEVLGALRVVAPLSLRLMSDSCEAVRESAALAFRNFVPLMALKVKSDTGKNVSKNDMADEGFTDCSMDLLLGDPSRLPPLLIENIKGISASVTLRPYQQEGIRWMSFLEEYGLSGILADDMGLGKTLQALCLLALKVAGKPAAKVLIVCPPTLVGHWCAEWSKYFPGLAPFHKVNEGIKDRRSLAMSSCQFATVASYNTIRACSYFQEIDWYYVILDEGHAIRNPMTQIFKSVTSLRAQNRLVLSGTPVQNTPADLWALFQFLMPGYLGSMKQFKVTFLKAINACRSVNASAKEIQDGQNALDRLHKAVLPFVLRRLKTDVLEDLPEKIVQDYMCTMTDVQRALYEHIIELCKSGQNAHQNSQSLSALETITELRKCIVHPLLVSPKAKNSFKSGELLGVASESGKMKALGQLLRECGIGSLEDYTTSEYSVQGQGNEVSALNAHRALIFCQRISTVQVIAEFFNSGQLGLDIRYSVLDGTVPVSERHAIAENFNNDPGIDVLLLTTSVGGEGLNLTGADVVIFVEHDWNPVKDLQAMDRAHRIGQKRTVNVYRLITEASIEQKIMRYQKFKTDTANALVGADNRSLQTMATEQLVELFALEGGSTTTTNHLAPTHQKLSKRSRSEHVLSNMDSTEKWNLEDLWDQSQYDRFNVVNIAMESAESAALRRLKRRKSSEVVSPSSTLTAKQIRRHY